MGSKKILAIVLVSLFILSCGGGVGKGPDHFPAVTLVGSPTEGVVPLSVSFTLTASDEDGAISRAECDLDGDGSFESDVTAQFNFTHIFQTAGTFNVSCRAYDNDGLRGVSNVQAIKANNPQVGEVIKSIPFPINTPVFSDVFFDSSTGTLQALGFATTPACNNPSITEFDRLTGSVLGTLQLIGAPAYLNCSSEMVRAGLYYYITSYGFAGDGTPQAFIYSVDLNGNVSQLFACPASVTGFCEGLAWDGTYLWTGASDNKNLVQFGTDGSVHATLTMSWGTNSVNDISFDPVTRDILMVKSGRLHRINSTTASLKSWTTTGSFLSGDWDGTLYWSVNNIAQKIEGIFVGE